MAFREVGVVEIREVLRLFLRGESGRSIERLVGVDRRTARSYIEAAEVAGLERSGGEEQLTDELLARVVGLARPSRPDGHGDAWRLCVEHRDFLAPRVEAGTLRLTKIRTLLRRERGVDVPYATLHRFCTEELGFGSRRVTVPILDGEPGSELQVDFGRMGPIPDVESERGRVLWALLFVAVYSRHLFVWPTFSQTIASVIEGFEEAWGFFGGVFKVVIPDNLKAIVTVPDRFTPRINDAFREYAQSRGFVIDPARVGTPTDKARVERCVSFARDSWFAGESFRDLTHARASSRAWCSQEAGMRIHRTTGLRPLELFVAEEQLVLLPAPVERYDLPVYAAARVHRDFHIQVAGALYSVPHGFVGSTVDVRADSRLVRISQKGTLIKAHQRISRGRVTDPADMPVERRGYAMRDLEFLKRRSRELGEAIGVYTGRLLDSDLPWTRMRAVYSLLSLVDRYGAERVDAACSMALRADVVDVPRVRRILERALDAASPRDGSSTPSTPSSAPRFAREPSEFRSAGGRS